MHKAPELWAIDSRSQFAPRVRARAWEGAWGIVPDAPFPITGFEQKASSEHQAPSFPFPIPCSTGFDSNEKQVQNTCTKCPKFRTRAQSAQVCRLSTVVRNSLQPADVWVFVVEKQGKRREACRLSTVVRAGICCRPSSSGLVVPWPVSFAGRWVGR